ncbi:sorbosone dehydrogenase family protein [soil metagenome]
MLHSLVAAIALLLTCSACAGQPALPTSAGFGESPQLPEPEHSLLPTMKIAPAKGWPVGLMPTAASGLRVQPFATGLDHPRWLYRLPNGDILVAESNAPPKPDDKKGGIKEWVQGKVMARAGAAVPSPDRIVLLRDADGDGIAELKTVFMSQLTSPFGMALVGSTLYIANADAVVAVPYSTGQIEIKATPVKIVDLPAQRNHHWTKSLVASPDGRLLYVGVGSNSNVADHGMDEEKDRANILEVDPQARTTRVYASGLRNPVGMAWNPDSGKLWVSVNERDEIGNDLVHEYMTSVTPGAFYGWPYSYYGQHVDTRVKPQDPARVASAIKPDYALGSHTASLGLTFYDGSLMPSFRNGAMIGQHGSWNREPPAGYKVIFVPFTDGKPSGPPQDVLTGFLSDTGDAYGRPVGVQTDRLGGLLVADDVGNAVWRVSPEVSTAPRARTSSMPDAISLR